MKTNLLLLGYSGQRNFGDDLLLKQAYNTLISHANITIHTSNITTGSDYLKIWFPEASIVKKVSFGFSFINKFDKVLYFGGGVFFDYSQYNLFEYIKKRASIFKNFIAPTLLGVRFAGVGIGIGPFESDKAYNIYLSLLNCFDYLVVRDEKSYGYALNAKRITTLKQSNDLSLAGYHEFKNLTKTYRKKNLITVCVRHYPHGSSKNEYIKQILKYCIQLKKNGKTIHVIGFQSNHDEEVLKLFAQQRFYTKIWDPDKMEVKDVAKQFALSEGIITARMHGVYLAGMLNRPVLAININPKLKLSTSIFKKSMVSDKNLSSIDFQEDKIFEEIDSESNNIKELEHISSKCQEVYQNLKYWVSNQI